MCVFIIINVNQSVHERLHVYLRKWIKLRMYMGNRWWKEAEMTNGASRSL